VGFALFLPLMKSIVASWSLCILASTREKVYVGKWHLWQTDTVLLFGVCRIFSVGDVAFGNMEEIIEMLANAEPQEERPTAQSFLDSLPRLQVKSAEGGSPDSEGETHRFGQGLVEEKAVTEHAAVGDPCAICHDTYERGEEVVELPCDHCFHEDCIMKWLRSHHTCPVRVLITFIGSHTARVHSFRRKDGGVNSLR
jgi:Ring finger domain